MTPDDQPPKVDNDVRGWVLVHAQVRGVLSEAAGHVQALRPGDAAGSAALHRWWESFDRSLRHHFRAEDQRIWPTLARVAPELADRFTELTHEHQGVEDRLSHVSADMQRLHASVGTDRFAAVRTALADELGRLEDEVRTHLAHEEDVAVPVLQQRVAKADWQRLEKDMVKGLRLSDVADLLPRMLMYADAATRDVMLHSRLPAPVRLLNRTVFEPRYRRVQASLPANKE